MENKIRELNSHYNSRGINFRFHYNFLYFRRFGNGFPGTRIEIEVARIPQVSIPVSFNPGNQQPPAYVPVIFPTYTYEPPKYVDSQPLLK